MFHMSTLWLIECPWVELEGPMQSLCNVVVWAQRHHVQIVWCGRVVVWLCGCGLCHTHHISTVLEFSHVFHFT